MKVTRFLTKEGKSAYGAIDAADHRMVRLITGDIFGEYRLEKLQEAGRFLAPVVPPVIYALGLNYRRHATETGTEYPDRPVVFIKAVTALIGPGEPIGHLFVPRNETPVGNWFVSHTLVTIPVPGFQTVWVSPRPPAGPLPVISDCTPSPPPGSDCARLNPAVVTNKENTTVFRTVLFMLFITNFDIG